MPDVVATLLPLALAIIMFAVGITLVPADFRRLAEQPRAVVAGLAGQLLLLPLAAWGIAIAFRLPAAMAVGLVIVAACPGGASSALITHLARGSAALSVTLTAVTSLVALVSMPIVVQFAFATFLGSATEVDLSLWRLVRGMFLISTVPVLAGMLLRTWRPVSVQRAERAIGRVATALFVLIVIATFVSQRGPLLENVGSVGPAAATLNILVMLGGVALARAFRLERRDALAIATECGLHNAGLGIFVATSVLAMPALAIPSVVYALLMNVGAFGLIAIGRKWVGGAAQPRESARPLAPAHRT